MATNIEGIAAQVEGGRNFDSPPLERWHPPLSGDIAIRITADGTWYHDGDPIRRESLRNLFASILRREQDGEYYLVTPVEKWRIEVELHPLIVVDVEQAGDSLELTLNTGKRVAVGQEHPLFLESRLDNVAAVELWHGLCAVFSRSAWYRLVEMADLDGNLCSGDFRLNLLGRA
ncbi:DUF1285 domain-containing protein [Pseudohalioglobus sediminis]|uniref:DUF1285 domain-containing protein n=1 Tax=Pseudohalioglobus sediminis TaxID=2606449 RepID=A0A5B0X1I2_9GAMM|nr:DUF1285 domain-containing protein [Pseudohalioglobus sediminis]KAA1193136.1 DUF1285 domain-containing protein [Pseudohalioglobus sediminis]